MHLKTSSLTVRLRAADRAALEKHFHALGSDDRRLRFGASISDAGLRQYVARIDFERDGLFAVRDETPRLLAVAHVAVGGGEPEMGLSVLPGFRGQGLGSAVFARGVMHLRNRGQRRVFMHCISENGAVMHLARKNGMRIVNAGAESDAYLALEPPTPHSRFAEWMQDRQLRPLAATAP